MADTLDVYLAGLHIGTLTKTRKGARFAYDEEVASSFQGRPVLSCALPAKSKPYYEGLTGAWFSGLLPEGARLKRLARGLGVNESDYFKLLKAAGWECAGAVSIVDAADKNNSSSITEKLSNKKLAERLRLIVEEGDIAEFGRVSLGGFQDKLCLSSSNISVKSGYVTSAKWAIPSPSQISTHILKPQPKATYEGIIEGEAWAMQVARMATSAANTWLLELDGAPQTLVVERYDRKRTQEGTCERVHLEDCAQALGIDPAEKYASIRTARGSDPAYAHIADLLVRYSEKPAQELEELLRQIVVNVVLGNTDAHAKNTAFIYMKPCVPSLAPMYDVVPVCDIDTQAKYFSMRVNGKVEISDITKTDVIEEAKRWGIDADIAEGVVSVTIEQIRAGIESASSLYPHATKRHSGPTARRLERFA
jgi:serine/threonine-protein kinase HipA